MLGSLLTSAASTTAVNNTVFQIMSEGTLKTVVRPMYTLADPSADVEVKKYAAAKEFIQNALTILAYFTAVSKYNELAFYFLKNKNKNVKDVVSEMAVSAKKQFKDFKLGDFDKALKLLAEANQKTERHIQAGGKMKLATLLGSCAMMAIILPQLVNGVLLHPTMKFVDKHFLSRGKTHKTNLDTKA